MGARFVLWTGSVTLLAAAGAAVADPVVESESNGSSSNNSLETAQGIAPAEFGNVATSDVFNLGSSVSIVGVGGGDDVDFYSFQSGSTVAVFDIDGAATGLDTYIAVFDASGTLLGDSDNSFPADPGSGSDLDALLGELFLPTSGTYFVAVAFGGNFANATFTGTGFNELIDPSGAFGGFSFTDATPGDASFHANGPQVGGTYTLNVSIPAPGAVALSAAALFMASRRQR